MLAVQAVDRNSQLRVFVAAPLDHVVLRLAEKSMLRSEECGDLKKIAIQSLENERRMLEL